MLLLHFSTGRQILYVCGFNILQDPLGTKACVIAVDLIDSDGNIYCLHCL